MAMATPDLTKPNTEPIMEPITELLKGITINDFETLKLAAEKDLGRRAPSPTLELFATIPTRVEHYDSIKLDSSKIPGAGRGIILLRDVAAGETLFKIARPLFTTVRLG
jgi:hypothetical protein